jgi:lipopolysaccharide transport system permease protein
MAEETASGVPVPVPAAAPAGDDLPETVVEPLRGWQVLNLRELWRSRELFYFLTWRDVMVRYKQTVLGAAWAVLQPLATMVVFSVFLGAYGGMSEKVEHYSLFVFAGVLPWTFFSNAVSAAGLSVVGNQHLVTKIYFPRLLLPLSGVGANLVDFAIAFVMLGVMMAWYGVAPGWQFLLVPVLVLLLMVASFGVGALLAALIVAHRDFRFILAFALQLWMFATPAVYMTGDVFGPRAQALLPLNPAYGLIYNFRRAVLGGPLDGYSLGVSAAVSVGLLLAGGYYFRRVERGFADII